MWLKSIVTKLYLLISSLNLLQPLTMSSMSLHTWPILGLILIVFTCLGRALSCLVWLLCFVCVCAYYNLSCDNEIKLIRCDLELDDQKHTDFSLNLAAFTLYMLTCTSDVFAVHAGVWWCSLRFQCEQQQKKSELHIKISLQPWSPITCNMLIDMDTIQHDFS